VTAHQQLVWVRALHTAIYVVMACASLVLLYAGVSGAHGRWLWIAGGLVAIESVIFATYGLRCPLTAVAARYGAAEEGVADTFLPERMTRHTFHVFGPLILLSAALIAGRCWWFGWR
jgi:hypothetical protein